MNMSNIIADKISAALQMSIAVKPEEYRFLDELIAGHEPVILCFGGSIAYGTNTPASDIDIRGAAMSPNKDFFDIVENYKQRFEKAAAVTALPEKPDFDRIEKFILDMHRDVVHRNVVISQQ